MPILTLLLITTTCLYMKPATPVHAQTTANLQ